MNAVDKIVQVLASGVLLKELTVVPPKGASEEQIADEEQELGIRLSMEYKSLLVTWNGINLDVISLMGCGETDPEIPRMLNNQGVASAFSVNGLVIGYDPAGFSFIESSNGEILCLDSDGGDVEVVASGFNDFITRYVFGSDADRFSHEEWKEELRDAGLLDE